MNARGVVRGRARMLRNALIGRGRAGARFRPRGPLVSLILAGAAAWIARSGFAALFVALAGAGATPAELSAALALALDLALAGLLLFDLEGVVSTLILDRDLDLLRAAPLTSRAVLTIKLVDALPRTAAPIVIVAIPALAAFGVVRPLPVAAWLALPVILALLWAVPLGAGVALTLAALARVPARRVRESVGLVSTVALTALWIGNLFVLPRIALGSGEPLERMRTLLASLGPVLALTPGAWAAAALAPGSPAAFGGAALLLAVAAAASLVLAALAAGRHLAPLLAAARAPSARARPRGALRPVRARRVPLLLAVMRRDRLLFVRDWTVLGDVLAAAVLWALLPLLAVPLRPFGSPGLVRAMLLSLSVGMGHEIGARAFPLERRGVEWMRLAPIPARSWAIDRLASAGALALAVVAIAGAGLGAAARLEAREWLPIVITVVPALALSVSLGLWTGITFGNPGWTSPRAVLTLNGRLAAAGLVVAQVAGWLGLTTIEQASPLPLWLPSVAACALVAIVVTALARRIAQPGYHR